MRVFFFSAFALILYQLFYLAEPFMTATLGAATLAMTFYPLHERLLRKFPYPTWAALLSSVCVILLAVLPLAGIGWLFVRETAQLTPVDAGPAGLPKAEAKLLERINLGLPETTWAR